MEKEEIKWSKEMADFSTETTFHGVRIACEKTFLLRRIVWCLILLAMTVLFLWTLIDTALQYNRYESRISIIKESNNSLTLPVITLCNYNLNSKSKIKQHFPDLEPFYMDLYQNASNLPSYFSDEAVIKALTTTALYDFYVRTAPTIVETFIECRDSNLFYLNCSEYVTSALTDRGFCYSFNTGTGHTKPMERKYPGLLYTVSLTLDVNPDDYITAMESGQGFVLLIHDQAVFPQVSIEGLTIAPGQVVYISLQKQVTKRLPKPFSEEDCVEDDADVSAGNMDSWPGYSKEECNYHCLMNHISSPSCVEESTGGNQTHPECSLYDLQILQYDKILDLYKNGLDCGCLPKCVSVKFEKRVSSTKFPNNQVSHYARSRGWPITDQQEIAARYSQVHVYFEDMYYTIMEQQPSMNLVQLLSNIGGQLGLYLGASIVSIMEVMDFFLVLFLKCCPCLKKKSGAKTDNTWETIH